MKKTMLLAGLLALCSLVSAQDIWFTRTGKIDFHAGTSVEDIDGTNNEVASMVNIKSGDLVFNVLVKSFHFKRALMEEHFNENYMESDKFPKASYKGKILNLPAINPASDGQYSIQTEGELTIHGVTKPVKSTGKLLYQKGKISTQSTFKILLSDYGIKIPSVVAEKISKEVTIIVNCVYDPKS